VIESGMASTPAPFFAFPPAAANAPAVTIVVPMFNEEGVAAALMREIAVGLEGRRFEIVAVDDRSTDGTLSALGEARADVPQLRVVAHQKNAGQSRAIRTGILAARGAVIATLDGDGQNDPADIGTLFERLTRPNAPEGLAMVAGERATRQDAAARKWASEIANRVRSRLLNDGARDTGCGLKLFYREAFLRLPAFDHMHRYLPALMRREGYVVEFAPVGHRARRHGRSKYTNLGRLAVAFRDLLGVVWLNARARSPGEISEL
jgi:glycosyltransferase involved in cell wall biosynthesis